LIPDLFPDDSLHNAVSVATSYLQRAVLGIELRHALIKVTVPVVPETLGSQVSKMGCHTDLDCLTAVPLVAANIPEPGGTSEGYTRQVRTRKS